MFSLSLVAVRESSFRIDGVFLSRSDQIFVTLSVKNSANLSAISSLFMFVGKVTVCR